MGNAMTISSFTGRASYAGSTSKTLSMDTALGNPEASVNLALSSTLQNGRGANQATLLWYDAQTLAASGTENVDLVGTEETAYGDTVNFDRVKGFIVKNTSSGTDTILRVGGAGATAWFGWISANDDYIRIRPGGVAYILAPDATAYDCSAGNDILKLENESATETLSYEIGIIGVEIDSSSSSSSESSSSSSSSESSSSESSSSST